MSTLGAQMAATASRMINKFGSNYNVYQDDSTQIGVFKGIETSLRKDLVERGLVQGVDSVYFFARYASVGELVQVDGERLYTSFVEVKRLQGSNIISRVVLQK